MNKNLLYMFKFMCLNCRILHRFLLLLGRQVPGKLHRYPNTFMKQDTVSGERYKGLSYPIFWFNQLLIQSAKTDEVLLN